MPLQPAYPTATNYPGTEPDEVRDLRHLRSYALRINAAACSACEMLISSAPRREAADPILAAVRDKKIHIRQMSREQIVQYLGKKRELATRYAEQIAKGLEIDTPTVLAIVQRGITSSLNQDAWLSAQARLRLPNQRLYETSVLPLNAEFATRYWYGGHFKRYGYTGRGSGAIKIAQCLNPSEHGRVANAWVSKVSALRSPGTSHTAELLTLFRTAVISHYGAPNLLTRAQENRQMALELLTALAIEKLDRSPVALQNQILAQEKMLSFHVTSLDVQTWVPRGEIAHKFDEESITIENQRAALLHFHALPTAITLQDFCGKQFQIQICPDIQAFNLPVHGLSFSQDLGFSGVPKQWNDEALVRLLARARSILWNTEHEVRLTVRKGAAIELLISQIEEIYTSEAFRKADADPFKLQSRIINLAYLLGDQVQLNCRSGKDRSGLVAAEAALLAIQLHFNPQTIDWRRPLRPAESQLLYDVATRGGSMYLQRLNSGMPGFKVKPVSTGELNADAFVSRLGGVDNWRRVLGFANYADT
jgi:phosphatidylinositol-4,5-bisphosphate 4-phosphatase